MICATTIAALLLGECLVYGQESEVQILRTGRDMDQVVFQRIAVDNMPVSSLLGLIVCELDGSDPDNDWRVQLALRNNDAVGSATKTVWTTTQLRDLISCTNAAARLLFPDDVGPILSVRLSNASLRRVLSVIVDVLQFDVSVDGTSITIGPGEIVGTETRLVRLSYESVVPCGTLALPANLDPGGASIAFNASNQVLTVICHSDSTWIFDALMSGVVAESRARNAGESLPEL